MYHNVQNNTNFWIKFYENERRIIGTPQKSEFLKSYRISIETTDGYTIVRDEFVVNVSDITILLFL